MASQFVRKITDTTSSEPIKKNADDIKTANKAINKNADDITQLKADVAALKPSE